jgi:hypothetical protein
MGLFLIEPKDRLVVEQTVGKKKKSYKIIKQDVLDSFDSTVLGLGDIRANHGRGQVSSWLISAVRRRGCGDQREPHRSPRLPHRYGGRIFLSDGLLLRTGFPACLP